MLRLRTIAGTDPPYQYSLSRSADVDLSAASTDAHPQAADARRQTAGCRGDGAGGTS